MPYLIGLSILYPNLEPGIMLTLYQYNLLPDKERATILWKEGVCLDLFRVETGFKIKLYALYSFYVEVWYDKDYNRIIKLRSFSSTAPLDAYFN